MKKFFLTLLIACLSTLAVSAQQLTPQQNKYLLKMKQQKASPAQISAQRASFVKKNLSLKNKRAAEAKAKADAAAAQKRKVEAAKAKKAADLAASKKSKALKAAKAKQKNGKPLSKEEKKLLVEDNQKDMQIRSARSPQQQKALENKRTSDPNAKPTGGTEKDASDYGNGTKYNTPATNKVTTTTKPPKPPRTHRAAAPNQLKTTTKSSSTTPAKPKTANNDPLKATGSDAKKYSQSKNVHMGAGEQKTIPHEGTHVVSQGQGQTVTSTTTPKVKTDAPNSSKDVKHEASSAKARSLMGEDVETLKKGKLTSKEMKAEKKGESNAKAWDKRHPNATPAQREWHRMTPAQRMDIAYILKRPLLERELKKECTKLYDTENIMFLEHVDVKSQQFIYETYIREEQLMTINVGGLRKPYVELGEKGLYSQMKFTPLKSEVTKLMRTSAGWKAFVGRMTLP